MKTVQEKDWTLVHGDCVEALSEVPDDTFDYSIFSPPFADLYVYSDNLQDMGNCANEEEFFEHFDFLVQQLFRTMKPGRLVSFHCMNLPLYKERHGDIGVRDFRGDLIRAFKRRGFIQASEVTIWKDPVTAMQRTKAIGLLYKQLKKDSTLSRQGIADYLVTMRKPGENLVRVGKDEDTFPVSLWQQWASPVWMDINPSDTLQFRSAREFEDERHICPLQLQVIQRGIRLWSNPGDLVMTPFAGIGSEVYEAVRAERRGYGIELKESYFKTAVANMQNLQSQNALNFDAEALEVTR